MVCAAVICVGPVALPANGTDTGSRTPQAHASGPHALDRTGRKRVGKASFYAKKFAGRTMADGSPMRPEGDNAASKTLPLGTTARVTNLDPGSQDVTLRSVGGGLEFRLPYDKKGDVVRVP